MPPFDLMGEQDESTLSHPKIIVTSIIFLQLKYLVTYGGPTTLLGAARAPLNHCFIIRSFLESFLIHFSKKY
jgi:hypothetical protein